MTRSFDLLWDILLELKRQFAKYPSSKDMVSALIGPEGFHVFAGNIEAVDQGQWALSVCIQKPHHCHEGISFFFVDDELTVEVLQTGDLNRKEIEFMSCFIPLCVMPNLAFKLKRTVSVLHLAQSIDGRMATIRHSSKWISNSENLVYVHRMRALCDGILIGARTLQKDKPALTVRFVNGPNPIKIVIGNSAVNFKSLLKSKGRVIHLVTRPGLHVENIETVCLHETLGQIPPVTILEQLYQLGINSVYIEGGSLTASSFIREKAVDFMNFYIAPVILGSGLSIEFNGIAKVEDALALHNCRYMPMGEGMLITGHFKRTKP